MSVVQFARSKYLFLCGFSGCDAHLGNVHANYAIDFTSICTSIVHWTSQGTNRVFFLNCILSKNLPILHIIICIKFLCCKKRKCTNVLLVNQFYASDICNLNALPKKTKTIFFCTTLRLAHKFSTYTLHIWSTCWY